MSIGIGLGAFMGSFEKGYGLGKQMRADNEENRLQKELKNTYDTKRQEFQEGVKAGQFNVADWDKFSQEHMYPEVIAAYEKRGDYKTANTLRGYFKSDEGIKQGRNYARGLFQYDIGDHENFANTANQILKENGFDGYGVTVIKGDGTLPLRYRVSMPDEGGKTRYTDMSPEEFLNNFNLSANPEKAGLLRGAKKDKDMAQAPGIAKKDEVNDAPTLSYKDAHKIESETMGWDGLSPEEQQKRVLKRQDMSRPSHFQKYQAGGISGQPALVDTVAGKPVGAPDARQQEEQPATVQKTAGNALLMGDTPTTPQAALAWAQQAAKSGMSDEAIAYGLNNSGLFKEGDLPQQWNWDAAGRARDEDMDAQDAFWGLTQQGRQKREKMFSQVDDGTRKGNQAIAKQSLVDEATKAIREKKYPLKEIYERMSKAGISIDDLPRDLQRIMRDAASSSGGERVVGKDFLKIPDEELLQTHANTQYKSAAGKKQHEKETEILQKIKAGEISQEELVGEMHKMPNASPEFKELAGRALKNLPTKLSPHAMPGVMRQNSTPRAIPISPSHGIGMVPR